MTTLIALSAAYGAGGSIIGPALARRLDVPFVDRAIPLAVADRLDVPYDDVAAHDEKVSAGLLERVLSGFIGGDTGVPTPLPAEAFSSVDFRRATEDVLLQQAATGAGVILGRAAVVLLREDPRALRVRLDGPPDRRVRRGLYHLVLDSTSIEFDACVEMIATAAKSLVSPDPEQSANRHP